ncbi:helix-turn-helix transcriptional regulator [Amycolatopsis sp. QT-25]|uniref:helix-turn-helix transcriptional regulator n=1 Tax=Amycolatopsis sp. QT-25 TaxID=3034022 RepID=UPI0023EAF939|nr:helix-turn-helix transcriptional regulator [Amycolatopsis sp. QT-25]WET83197.1 helix-turn-helix transcriptional regulator [Amycolatopsis sp. QT-25]
MGAGRAGFRGGGFVPTRSGVPGGRVGGRGDGGHAAQPGQGRRGGGTCGTRRGDAAEQGRVGVVGRLVAAGRGLLPGRGPRRRRASARRRDHGRLEGCRRPAGQRGADRLPRQAGRGDGRPRGGGQALPGGDRPASRPGPALPGHPARGASRRGRPRRRHSARGARAVLRITRGDGRRRHRIRSTGVATPSRRGRRGYGDELSPREQDVARLLAGGHTNREIAQALFLSRRTVEDYVVKVRRKLNAPSRHDVRL